MENSAAGVRGRRPLSVDGVGSRPLGSRGAQPQPTPPPVRQRKVYYQPRPEPKENRFWQKLQLPLLLLAGATGGFFAENLVLGLAMLTVYGVVAFVARITSRTTFMLALLLITAISVMLLLKPSDQLIRNFATYAFVLLLIGAVTLGREARPPKRTRRKYRR